MNETTELTRPFSAFSFRQFLSERKLMASRCTDCGALYLPPRAICPACHASAMTWAETSGRGRLAAFTVIYVAPNAMIRQGFGRENPYVSGIVELEEGVKISARIVGVDAAHPETIRVGAPVQVHFIQSGEGETKTTDLAFAVL